MIVQILTVLHRSKAPHGHQRLDWVVFSIHGQRMRCLAGVLWPTTFSSPIRARLDSLLGNGLPEAVCS